MAEENERASRPRGETDKRLRRELTAARAEYEHASKEFDRLNAIARDVGSSTDGIRALRQATSLYSRALQRYQDAVHKFVEFTVKGKAPR